MQNVAFEEVVRMLKSLEPSVRRRQGHLGQILLVCEWLLSGTYLESEAEEY
jgi:hypothetical protein